MTAPTPPMEYTADCASERLDVFLARRLIVPSRSIARRRIDDGLVRVEGELERASYRLGRGDCVQVWPPEPSTPLAEPQAIPLDVIHEDGAFIVINKAAGLTVHPAPGHSNGTLVNALLAHCPEMRALGDAIRPGVVHRLDKDTSGVIVVAKTAVAQRAIQDQLRERRVEKRYLAVVAGVPDPEEGVINAPIGRDPVSSKRMAVVEGGRAARTEYRVLERFHDTALVEAKPITGRTHQIRVHLTAVGHPIIGDPVYAQRSEAIGRQALHAAVLAFHHPVSGELVRYEAKPPADFESLLTRLRSEAASQGVDQPDADRRSGRAADGTNARRSRHRARHIR